MSTYRRTNNDTRNGADPINNAFLLVTEVLAQLQEALHLQEQRAATAMREMEQKLREKDDTIRALQQQLQETEYRAPAADGEENPSRPESSSASISSDADEEERERQRVKLRVREVEFKMEHARNSPSSLGEKLQEAATKGDLSEVRRLIDSGADVNYPDKFGCTPLHRAVNLEAHVGVVNLLLQRGADAKAVSSSGNSVLHWVATKDPSGLCVDLLVNAGADINARNLDGVTPLLRAAGEGNEKAVRALLSAGARRDLKPWGGRWRNKTPFEVATSPDIRDLLRL